MKIYVYSLVFLIVGLCGEWTFGFGVSGPSTWVGQSAFCIIIALALVLQKSWTEHALFGVAIFISVTWIATIFALIIQGYPEHGVFRTVLSLVPGTIYCGFWILMWFLVRRYFSARIPKSIQCVPKSNSQYSD